MKITIIFPARDFEIGKATMPVMPLAPTLLAALTPQEHEISLIDMFYGDEIDYDSGCDLVANRIAEWKRFPSAPEGGPGRTSNDETQFFAAKTVSNGFHIHNPRLPEPLPFLSGNVDLWSQNSPPAN